MSYRSGNLADFFSNKNRYKLLTKCLHGLEKETLRTDPNGNLALTPHPKALGNKLTDPYITTDFSESQLEFITPPFPKIEQSIKFLEKLHKFTFENLENEFLWPFSMPNKLPKDEVIPIAKYGKTKEGQKKEIYRRGLALRYGKSMQTICGIHYNFSFNEDFWDALYEEYLSKAKTAKPGKQNFINESYLHIVRNFIRYRWLLVYIFGASPVHDSSYKCKKINQDESNAISLRQSRCGYSNPAKIHITFNNFNQHLNDLRQAVKTPIKKYTELGIHKNGLQVQLNDHLLQISNEYYFPIRLKPSKKQSTDMLDGLTKYGVSYIELRMFDLDPFNRVGISANVLRFVHLFIIFCLCADSPFISQKELNNSNENQIMVALYGRRKRLLLKKDGTDISMNKWIKEILNMIKPFAKLVDKNYNKPVYGKTIKYYQKLIEHPEKLPANSLIRQFKKTKTDFIGYGIKKAKSNKKYFTAKK